MSGRVESQLSPRRGVHDVFGEGALPSPREPSVLVRGHPSQPVLLGHPGASSPGLQGAASPKVGACTAWKED